MAKKDSIKRVYKFLSEKWALEDIRTRRIKISEIHDLNDPFELIPFDLSDSDLRRELLSARDQMNKSGVLSFSRCWSSPLLWAHYADKHRGICLGFDVARADKISKEVEYVEKRLPCPEPDDLDKEDAQQFLFTKFADWKHEEEVRVWTSRNVEENGVYFANFDEDKNNLTLREVIVGHRCCTERGSILALLSSYSQPVSVIKARLSYDSFRVVVDENGFAG